MPKTTDLPVAPLPLTGTEAIPIAQGGVSYQTTALEIKNSIRAAENLADNVVEVFSASDFPTPIGNKSLLVDRTKYIIKAPVTISFALQIPNSGVSWFECENDPNNTLLYIGLDPLFENEATGISQCNQIYFTNFSTIATNPGTTLFNLDFVATTLPSLVLNTNSLFLNFADPGRLSNLDRVQWALDVFTGIQNKFDLSIVSGGINECSFIQNGLVPLPTGPTIELGGSPQKLRFSQCDFSTNLTSSVFNIKANISPTSQIEIVDSDILGGGELFKQGNTGTFTAVTDLGAGMMQVTADTTGLSNGDIILLKSIVYNNGGVVSNVTPTTFDVDIVFISGSGSESGTWNNGSLDYSNERIKAVSNGIATRDSRPLASLYWNETTSTTSVSNTNYQPISLDASQLNAFSQNYTLVDETQGVLRWDGLDTKVVKVEACFVITQSGGTNTYRFTIVKNGVFPLISDQVHYTPLAVVNAEENGAHIQIIELAQGDTFQIAIVGDGTTTGTEVISGCMVAE